ncbi:DUF624 domain-containing protein [Jeotgalibacillus sp. ET6]|uniref:DUF624 domain-containing protein n=1 Tax=Jeotgalibacillus sp. ET6 TaxID=3037260 RepID=UPI0024184D8C|nr:DUF624 domain-containing protein [Jeotgalibacillus sp. ET6]MDG5471530.1 DUF624 domain-containing protein [Jeotgalibacillus sp. ET6]
MKQNQIIAFVQWLYRGIMLSLHFWIALLRGAVIYSLVPAMGALFASTAAMLEKKEDEEVRRSFWSTYRSLKSHKGLSFFFSLTFILIVTLLFYLNRESGSFALLSTIIVFYLLGVALLLLVYSAAVLTFSNPPGQRVWIYSFVLAFRNLPRSILLLLLVWILTALLMFNMVLFIVLAPFAAGLSTQLLISGVVKGQFQPAHKQAAAGK